MGSIAYYAQISSQPAAVARVLAETRAPKLDPDRPIVFTGIGSSLHACMTAAAWVVEITTGRIRPAVVDAHELVLAGGVHAGEQVIVVSHRGTKRFTNMLLSQAANAGATSIMITGNGAASPAGDVVLRTCDDEKAGAHTVSYTTALATLALLVATLGGPRAEELTQALQRVPQAMRDTLDVPAPAAVADRLARVEPLLISGDGIDAPTAEEIALKLKESTFQWAEAIGTELSLHGTPAAFRPGMAALILRPEHDDHGRASDLAEFLHHIGAPVFDVAAGGGDIPFAPVPLPVRPLVSVVALQRLVGAIADRTGGDPDTIRGNQEPWAAAIKQVRL